MNLPPSSGLGLFITKGLVDLHHGNIRVFSQGEGTGCTFTVELPMIRKLDHPLFPGNHYLRERRGTLLRPNTTSISRRRLPISPSGSSRPQFANHPAALPAVQSLRRCESLRALAELDMVTTSAAARQADATTDGRLKDATTDGRLKPPTDHNSIAACNPARRRATTAGLIRSSPPVDEPTRDTAERSDLAAVHSPSHQQLRPAAMVMMVNSALSLAQESALHTPVATAAATDARSSTAIARQSTTTARISSAIARPSATTARQSTAINARSSTASPRPSVTNAGLSTAIARSLKASPRPSVAVAQQSIPESPPLPSPAASSPCQNQSHTKQPLSLSPLPQGPVYHVLVVDDSTMTRKMLMKTLRNSGMTYCSIHAF